MDQIIIEQARFLREDTGTPRLSGRSPGFREDWLHLAQRLAIGFGNRPTGQVCPGAIFARPLGPDHVAVVQVADRIPAGTESAVLGFHILVMDRGDYETYLGDPFWVARKFPADWSDHGPLEALVCPRESLPPRTVADVQRVLSRVKAGALKEDDDPEAADFQRTPENSESPALLGGVQVLVEGGKLVFERPAPDNELLQGLWTLLPNRTRARLWPASFAFDNTLGFDAVVVPRLHRADFEGYTSEEQAAEYPQGHYELTLQIAAESGNQRELDHLLNRRSGRDTLRLAWLLLLLVLLLGLAPKAIDWVWPPPEPAGVPAPVDVPQQSAAAAGMVGVRDPWTAIALRLHGKQLFSGPAAAEKGPRP